MTDTSVVEQDALPICPVCSESFGTHRGLASHMKKHAKPTTCPVCFQEVRYLSPHLVKEHPERNAGEQIVADVRALVEENISLKARITELETLFGDSSYSTHSPVSLRDTGNGINPANKSEGESIA
jgi:hypothetical protein